MVKYNPNSNFLKIDSFNGMSTLLEVNNWPQGELPLALKDLVEALGEEALTSTTIYSSGYEYSSEEEAIQATFDYLETNITNNTKGSGIVGRRTRNTEISIDSESSGEPPETLYNFSIGSSDGAIDTPNFWDNIEYEHDGSIEINSYTGNELINLYNSLENVKEKLNTYFTLLNTIKNILNNISNGIGTLGKLEFTKNKLSGIDSTIFSYISTIEVYKNIIDEYSIIVSGDTPIIGISGGLIINTTNFNANNSELNSKLLYLKGKCIELRNEISTRVNSTYGTSQGDILYELLSLRNFWLDERILKPKGSLFIKESLNKSLIDLEAEASSKKDILTKLFSNDETHWLPKPILFAAFYNPLTEESNNDIIFTKRINIVFSNQKYGTTSIYKKFIEYSNFNELTLSNDNEDWGTAFVNNFNGTEYKDLEIISTPGTYLYKIETVYDDPEGESSSWFNNILGEEFNYEKIIGQQWSIKVEIDFSGYVYIENKINKIISSVEKKEEETNSTYYILTLENNIISNGTIQNIYGISDNYFLKSLTNCEFIDANKIFTKNDKSNDYIYIEGKINPIVDSSPYIKNFEEGFIYTLENNISETILFFYTIE